VGTVVFHQHHLLGAVEDRVRLTERDMRLGSYRVDALLRSFAASKLIELLDYTFFLEIDGGGPGCLRHAKPFGKPTHSLRRTKATLIYRRTGNLRAVQLLLGHSKIESTVRCLGIEVDDALAIAEQVDVGNTWAERTCPAHLPSTALGQEGTSAECGFCDCAVAKHHQVHAERFFRSASALCVDFHNLS
jgi:hypothetical protein